MGKTMYKITGLNSLYFLLAENEREARETIKADETAEKCSPNDAYSIRYGGQPLYEVVKGVDRRNGLPYSMQITVDKREYLTNHPEIHAERRYF